MSWTNRVPSSSRTPPLRQVQAAAQNLADQAGIAPGRARVAFQIVTDVAILTSALIGGTLGAVHLWKTLFPKHREDRPAPETAGGNRSPPRSGSSTAMAFADGRDGRPERSRRSR